MGFGTRLALQGRGTWERPGPTEGLLLGAIIDVTNPMEVGEGHTSRPVLRTDCPGTPAAGFGSSPRVNPRRDAADRPGTAASLDRASAPPRRSGRTRTSKGNQAHGRNERRSLATARRRQRTPSTEQGLEAEPLRDDSTGPRPVRLGGRDAASRFARRFRSRRLRRRFRTSSGPGGSLGETTPALVRSPRPRRLARVIRRAVAGRRRRRGSCAAVSASLRRRRWPLVLGDVGVRFGGPELHRVGSSTRPGGTATAWRQRPQRCGAAVVRREDFEGCEPRRGERHPMCPVRGVVFGRCVDSGPGARNATNPCPAAGCNRPATSARRKPSRWGGTTRTARDPMGGTRRAEGGSGSLEWTRGRHVGWRAHTKRIPREEGPARAWPRRVREL